MSLPYDVARCDGSGSDDEGWREGCDMCLRRLDRPADTEARLVWMEPPLIVAFECEYLITDHP